MWSRKKLKDVCDISSGLWRGKKDPLIKAKVLRNTNFTSSGELSFENVAELDVELKQFEKRKLKKGDIILEKSGGGEKKPVGRVCLFNLETSELYSFSNFTARLRVLDRNELDPIYLHRFLYFLYISGETEVMQRYSTAIRNLQLTQYKDIEIPLPPLMEQHRIVAKLDSIFSEINRAIISAELKQAEINKFKDVLLTNELNNSRVSKLSELVKLKNTAKFIRGITYSKKDEVEKDGMAVLRATNIDLTSYKLVFDEIRYIDKSVNVNSDKLARKGDVLMCTASGSKSHLGKVALVNENIDMAFGGFMAALRCEENCLPEFLYFVLISQGFISHLSSISDGVNINNLKFAQIADYELLLPPLAEQQCVVVKLNTVFKELERAMQAIEKIKTNYGVLKSAILKQELQTGAV